LELEEEATKSR